MLPNFSFGCTIKENHKGDCEMANNIDQMIIEKVVIHQIFRRENMESVVPPHFNELCSELDNESLDALKKRFTKALGNNSHSMKMRIKDTSDDSVFSCLSEFWRSEKSDSDFISLSKKMTRLLTVAQDNRTMPGGVIVIVKGKVTEYKKDYIAIIKAEKHDGFNIREEEGRNLLEYFNSLVLSPQQKLQKIGYFVFNKPSGDIIAEKNIDAYVFDSNTSAAKATAHAEYFYAKFLGLDFRTDADYITNQFYISTRSFINESLKLTVEDKLRLQSDLRNYLESESTRVINPNDFIQRTVTDGVIIDEYLKYVEAQKIPLQDTRKYLTLTNLKDRKMSFDNKIKLIGPSEAFKENVSIETNEDNTTITIKGKYISEN